MVQNGASARLAFPVVGGYGVKNASVEGLVIDGNRGRTKFLNGCRGGGIYLFECEDIAMRNCVVRGYNGDGISFQVSQGVTIEGCTVEGCAGIGLHPGSGSGRPVVRGNRSSGNDGDGMYVCWRVKNGVFEENVIEGNKGNGISIGHKDTDNVFRRNRVNGNGGDGLLFREESEAMAAHRNVFEENEFLDNGGGRADRYPVRILGHTHDLVLRNNRIGHSQGRARGSAFRVGPDVKGLKLEKNALLNVVSEQESGE
jgi:parallel beta-helix repeat protein